MERNDPGREPEPTDAERNTQPMPAVSLLALADRMADESLDPFERREAAEAYRAARAASPRTLEEALMAGSCRAYNDYIFARDLPGNGDVVELLEKYNAAHRAQAEHACTLSVKAYEKESDARRLAGEGGA